MLTIWGSSKSIQVPEAPFSLMFRIRVTAIAILPLFASCAGSGLYYMSDQWCDAHLRASPARCPEHQEPLEQQQRVAANEAGRSDEGLTTAAHP